MMTWKDLMVEQERRREMRDRASRLRQVESLQQLQVELPGRSRWLAARGIALGRWLEQTGCRLRSRFERQLAIEAGQPVAMTTPPAQAR